MEARVGVELRRVGLPEFTFDKFSSSSSLCPHPSRQNIMPHDLAGRIEYSEKYLDDKHEYRCVQSPTCEALPFQLLLPLLR